MFLLKEEVEYAVIIHFLYGKDKVDDLIRSNYIEKNIEKFKCISRKKPKLFHLTIYDNTVFSIC